MLERVHSESPNMQILSGMLLGAQLRNVERTRRDAKTAPFNSERGVDILCRGVTRDLQLTRVVKIEPSLSVHLT